MMSSSAPATVLADVGNLLAILAEISDPAKTKLVLDAIAVERAGVDKRLAEAEAQERKLASAVYAATVAADAARAAEADSLHAHAQANQALGSLSKTRDGIEKGSRLVAAAELALAAKQVTLDADFSHRLASLDGERQKLAQALEAALRRETEAAQKLADADAVKVEYETKRAALRAAVGD